MKFYTTFVIYESMSYIAKMTTTSSLSSKGQMETFASHYNKLIVINKEVKGMFLSQLLKL